MYHIVKPVRYFSAYSKAAGSCAVWFQIIVLIVSCECISILYMVCHLKASCTKDLENLYFKSTSFIYCIYCFRQSKLLAALEVASGSSLRAWWTYWLGCQTCHPKISGLICVSLHHCIRGQDALSQLLLSRQGLIKGYLEGNIWCCVLG